MAAGTFRFIHSSRSVSYDGLISLTSSRYIDRKSVSAWHSEDFYYWPPSAGCKGSSIERQDRTVVQIEGLAQLPKGEYLKPALLGYHHLGADLLWLKLVQVMGNKRNSEDEYEWMYHALDVITTLDPAICLRLLCGRRHPGRSREPPGLE